MSIIWRVGEDGRRVIESVYPKLAEAPDAGAHRQLPAPDRTIVHRGKSGIVLGINIQALVIEAQRGNAVIELVPRVGDFVGVGEPLFQLYGSAGSINERRLRGAVAFGPERTIEQDSTFAFRIIVDIAIKALSKAINDPTTAVLALDQLQRLLGVVGMRHLHDEEIPDGSGQLRVILRTPNWVDFVDLSFSEVRLYGAENFQVARRPRAMIEYLLETLPEYRRLALRYQLDLLDRALEKSYAFREDVTLARVPDSQGLGGAASP